MFAFRHAWLTTPGRENVVVTCLNLFIMKKFEFRKVAPGAVSYKKNEGIKVQVDTKMKRESGF